MIVSVMEMLQLKETSLTVRFLTMFSRDGADSECPVHEAVPLLQTATTKLLLLVQPLATRHDRVDQQP